MPQLTRRRVRALSAPLLACLLSACPGDGEGDDTVASAGATLRIQITGSLLAVPSKRRPGQTHLLMPSVRDHYALIAFRGAPGDYCIGYDRAREICYVDIDGWDLDSLGVGTHASTESTRIPRGALDLTHGSGGVKIPLDVARARARSEITLYGGAAAGSPCSLASWRFDPRGLLRFPRRLELINVLGWDIPLSADSLVLKRRRHNSADPLQKLVTLRPNGQDRIELLIMHVSLADLLDIITVPAPRRQASHAGSATAFDSGAPVAALVRQWPESAITREASDA